MKTCHVCGLADFTRSGMCLHCGAASGVPAVVAPVPTDEDEATAAELVALGFESTSNKYRHVARLPEGKTAVEALSAHDPRLVDKIMARIERECASTYRRCGYAEKDGNQRALTPEEFVAFKKAGGVSSW